MVHYAAYVGTIHILFQGRIHSDTCNGAIHLPYLLDALVLLLDKFFEISLLLDQPVDILRLPDQHVTQLYVFRMPLS